MVRVRLTAVALEPFQELLSNLAAGSNGREPLASFVEGSRVLIVLHEPLMENNYDRSNLSLVITSGS